LKATILPQLEAIPLGSAGSRLLRGHLQIFEDVENVLAQFCGRETALLYSSGFQANMGLLSAVLGPQDLVYSDQYNHASLIDGIRLSGAQKQIYPHFNVPALRGLLQASAKTSGLKFIVTESLFGMDGDIAPLRELVELAEEFSALVIVDEAHATGLWGDFEMNLGGGLVQAMGLSDRVFATIHPGGKAMGMGGGWVCGDAKLKDYLINCSRAFIFSTAPMPLMAIGLSAAVNHWQSVGRERAQKVLAQAKFLQKVLREENGLALGNIQGAIVPVILGENARTLEVAEGLQERGFDVRAIRPPTVPHGTARLRVTINSLHSVENILHLCRALAEVEE
jgi:8-amino-7-oxononanoate synthase